MLANKLYSDIYRLAEPYYCQGEHISPIAHVECVVEYAEMFAQDLDESEEKILMLAAILHDVGNCRCKMPKIVESDVINHPELKQAAIDCRKEHMKHGGVISRNLLHDYHVTHQDSFTYNDLCEIIKIVENHDNYKIKRYDNSIEVYEDKLMLMLNKADALWMLTPKGVETDIWRGSGKTRMEQITHNAKTINSLLCLVPHVGIDQL